MLCEPRTTPSTRLYTFVGACLIKGVYVRSFEGGARIRLAGGNYPHEKPTRMSEVAANTDETEAEEAEASVLVIDDSEIALEILLGILARHGIPAVGLPGPIGATNTVVRKDIRVVVTDVNMPELTGNNLVALFRNNARTKHVKVILVSDLPSTQLHDLVLSCNANGAVQKDKLEHELVPLVRRLLKASVSKTGPMRMV